MIYLTLIQAPGRIWEAARRQWRIVAMAGVAVTAVAMLVLSLLAGGGAFRPREKLSFTCGACDRQWRDELREQNSCPSCGGEAVVLGHYRCPNCTKVFVGIERRRVGVGQFEWRLPGAKQWMTALPPELTCPGCGLRSSRLHDCAVAAPASPSASPPAAARPGSQS